jgi:hypothetical protein
VLWCGAVAGQGDAIGFAEKVLELLDEGRYTATYKYAVLLALIDLCLEGTQASGAPPAMVTTRQLADKIVEPYGPHTVPFARAAAARILRQNTRGQAEIVSAILRFRSRHAPDASAPRWHARLAAPAAYERLVRTVEWKLIEMPLPRLQRRFSSAPTASRRPGSGQGSGRSRGAGASTATLGSATRLGVRSTASSVVTLPG